MTALEQRLRRRIATEGPITFAEFMAAALYDPEDGYYAAGPARTGWEGHFVTSPELHPLFAELWTRFFHTVWLEAGRPSRFRIVEVGPGEGAFARGVLDAMPSDMAAATVLELVEPFAGPRDRQMRRLEPSERVRWSASLGEVGPGGWGCVFANEVLDNLPVHLVTLRAGELKELWVEAPDGLELVAGEPSTPELAGTLERLGVAPAEQGWVEVCLEMPRFVAEAARCLERGALVFVDYGVSAADLRAMPRATLAAYSAGEAASEPLRAPGTRDLTAHVLWDALVRAISDEAWEPAGPFGQRDFLRGLGLSEADRGAAREHRRALSERDGPAALRALSRRAAAGLLASPSGLGSLAVCLGLRGVGREAVTP